MDRIDNRLQVIALSLELNDDRLEVIALSRDRIGYHLEVIALFMALSNNRP